MKSRRLIRQTLRHLRSELVQLPQLALWKSTFPRVELFYQCENSK